MSCDTTCDPYFFLYLGSHTYKIVMSLLTCRLVFYTTGKNHTTSEQIPAEVTHDPDGLNGNQLVIGGGAVSNEILEVVVDLCAEDDWVEGKVVEGGQCWQEHRGERACGVTPGMKNYIGDQGGLLFWFERTVLGPN